MQARNYGVQVMVEGPGHVPLNKISSQIKTMKDLIHNAPLYVLGPLAIDNGAGYDHISAAIGASMAVLAGADFLCYVTPAEHVTLPNKDDVYMGIKASQIAAAAAEVALGRKSAINQQENMSKARNDLDWKKMELYAIDGKKISERRKDFKDEKECAMCGKFCSMKVNR